MKNVRKDLEMTNDKLKMIKFTPTMQMSEIRYCNGASPLAIEMAVCPSLYSKLSEP